MLYLVKPKILTVDPRGRGLEEWTDAEETLCSRHATIAVVHLMLVLGVAWSLVISCW